uniref:Ubiquitin-like domain-containing protein n=1 Tax=Panagrolaimus sp. PS1159 TaxID=55785 RepID=A0AC35GC61_9BILA
MSASVKLRFLDEDGVTEHSKRFAVSDDTSTVAEAIQKGLDRLECPSLTCQLVMYGQRRGSGKPFRVHMDDYVELGYDYVFVDPRLEDSNVPSFSTPSTPTTSAPMAFKSPAALATPTTSRRAVATVATPTT